MKSAWSDEVPLQAKYAGKNNHSCAHQNWGDNLKFEKRKNTAASSSFRSSLIGLDGLHEHLKLGNVDATAA